MGQPTTSMSDEGLVALISDAVLLLKRRGRTIQAVDVLMRELADINLEHALGSFQGAVSAPAKKISRKPRQERQRASQPAFA